MNTKQTTNPADRVYLGQMLTTLAECVSGSMSKLSGSMLLGYAAILGALCTNLDSVSKYLAPNTLSRLVILFAVVVLLALLARYLAAVVSGSVEAGKKSREHPMPDGIDVVSVLAELERATLWPARIMVRRSNRKMMDGDLAASGRLVGTLAQVQSWIVVLQALVSFAATILLACGLSS